jgi:hypothetical protein
VTQEACASRHRLMTTQKESRVRVLPQVPCPTRVMSCTAARCEPTMAVSLVQSRLLSSPVSAVRSRGDDGEGARERKRERERKEYTRVRSHVGSVRLQGCARSSTCYLHAVDASAEQLVLQKEVVRRLAGVLHVLRRRGCTRCRTSSTVCARRLPTAQHNIRWRVQQIRVSELGLIGPAGEYET